MKSCFKKEKKGEKKGKKRVIGKIQKLFGVKPSKPASNTNAKPPTYIFEEQVTPQNTPQNSSSGENEKIPLVSKEGKKKAVLIGLNYPNSLYTLSGCVNDVKNGDAFLKAHGYDSRFLEDKDVSDKYDVLEALEELKNSDSKVVFFHYSGHGTQVQDTGNDEMDGKDEVVYSKNGHLITDDDINEKLAGFGEDKLVFLIFDCCHSGTMADLRYQAVSYEPYVREEKVKKEVRAKVICVSGCRDNQVSSDITEKGTSYGALTKTLYDILRKNEETGRKIKWSELYQELLIEMTKKHYSQIPQMSASSPALFNEIVQF